MRGSVDTIRDFNTRYAEKFWTIGNAIAGFDVVQNIAFSLTLQDSALYCALLDSRIAALILLAAIILSFFVYRYGIRVCGQHEKTLLGAEVSEELVDSLNRAQWLRTATVLIVTIVLAAMTLDIWLPASRLTGAVGAIPAHC